MATLPRHPPSWTQQRASPSEESAPAEHEQEQEHPPRANSFSAASIDSQTVLLNSPPTEREKPAETTQDDAPKQTASVSPPAPAEDNEPRRCWICFTDETEDDENTSEWRSPCPCVLVAHEKCLLDWIADMEAPNARRRAGQSAGKILCPQCKSEIRLQRPKSAVVQLVRGLERLAKTTVLPGIAIGIGTATVGLFTVLGKSAVYEVFGQPDTERILRPIMPRIYNRETRMYLLQVFRLNWRLHFGLPAIPLTLILSRTRLADSFLPFIPLVFLAGSEGLHSDALVRLQWPPSPAFTIATLPYVRSFYNFYYDRVWAPHEQRWLKEVQPRAPSTEEIDADIQGGGDAEVVLGALAEEDAGDDNDDDVVELEVDVDLLLDWNAGGPADNNNAPENPPVPIARGPARPLDAPPVDDEAPAVAPAPNVPRQPAQPRRARVRRERNATFSTTGIVELIMGAVFLPAIAARTGELLELVLPASWTRLPRSGKATGFLQNKWARSIVGGCLFVGLKDAVMLYVRWRMAQSHRQRKVLDYDQSKGKKKSTKAT